MSQPTNYPGIDYGLGISNINHSTGIRFGVISQHSINPDALSDIESVYGDPTCPKCGNQIEQSTVDPRNYERYSEHGCDDYVCATCQHCLDSADCFPDEPIGLEYKQDGYRITDCLDSDLFILESPYYTRAQYCSPCVPGAGNLDTPCPDGPRTYCLGHDWFDSDIAPYPVFRVSDNVQLLAAPGTETCPNCKGTGRDTLTRVAEVRGVTVDSLIPFIGTDELRVTGYKPDDNTFDCWRCNGTGTLATIIITEVHPD